MRIVVAGAGGGLGRAFLDVVGGGTEHEVHAFTHAELEIADGGAVGAAIEPLRPDLIINAAGATDVDRCERDIDYAMAGNALGPWKLALAAERCGAKLLHVSTDYVFDGGKGAPYDETDEPAPINRYGVTKVLGEQHVRETTDRHLVVRTGFVFGGGRDYLTGALRHLEQGEPAGGLVDRVGSPTYVRHLAERLLPLVRSERTGTFHLVGPEPTTWHDVLARAKSIAPERLGGDVLEQRADELNLLAPRPRDSSLTSVRVPDLPVDPMPPLDDAIREHLASL